VPRLTVRAVDALPAEDAGELDAHRVRYLRLPATAQSIEASMTIEPSDLTARLVGVRQQGAVVGATDVLSGAGAATLSPGRMSNMEIAACLKRVLVSIKTRDGVRAYLEFLDDVLP
jgi:hypothetical protein